MKASPQGLARELAPLLAKELVSELEKRNPSFRQGIQSLQQEPKKSRFRSEEEREQWAEMEAQMILREIRQRSK